MHTALGHNDTLVLDSVVIQNGADLPPVMADIAVPQGPSSSMQDVAHRLLSTLQVEGYRIDVIIGDSNAGI